MARPSIVSTLPEGEHQAVAEALSEAGLDLLALRDPADLEATLARRPDVGAAILDGDVDADRLREYSQLLSAAGHLVPSLVVLGERSLDRLADESAVSDAADVEYFLRPFAPAELRWRLEALLIRSQTVDDGSGPVIQTQALSGDGLARRATVVSVFNPKGGVGKTTLASNLAMALQMRCDQQVLLVDADTTSGHIASSLGLEHVTTVADAWEEEQSLPHGLAGASNAHPTGLQVAILTTNPLQADRIEPARLGDQLLASRVGFDVVVVDLHPDYGDLNRVVFERSDRILVPVTPDLPALRAALQFVEIAGDLGVRERLALVVNRANSGVSVEDMEQTTGMRAFGRIRSGGLLFVRAANEGRTVVEKYPKDPVTGDLVAIADRLLGREPRPVPSSRGLLDLLTRRRQARAGA
ncbi:MAG TPA: AAA family ATPase [Candidatus Limnocylindrales bacterium]|nr:AAA family ATPase [Candidatus Limnocylindrales bacterium]